MTTAPSYYPPGWNADRWQTATDEEFATLTENQFATFHAGIRADLGEHGAEEFFAEMERRQAEVRKAASGPSALAPFRATCLPNFVLPLEQQIHDDSGEYLEWGFVIFRTAGYSDHDREFIQGVKERIDTQIDRQLDDSGFSEDVQHAIQRARQKFKLMWIEGENLDGAAPEEIARRYREQQMNVSVGLSHMLCLCVDRSSLASIHRQSDCAHVLAVSSACGLALSGDEAEDETWSGSFKVAVRTLVQELFPLIGNDSFTPYEIGVGVTNDLVWTDTTRWGRQKASIL